MKLAVVKNGVVLKAIVADIEWARENLSIIGGDEVVASDEASPGWSWNGETFSPPPMLPPDPVTPEALTPLAFMRRFTPQEMSAVLSSEDPLVKSFVLMLQVAQDVRLEDPATVDFVNYAALQGFIVPERVIEILSHDQA